MKKTLSYTTAFCIGFVMCACALKALYGFEPSGILPGTQDQSKQAVLAVLNTPPEPLRRTAGDSVIADAAAKVEPSVVDVHTVGKAIEESDPFGNDPIFRQFGFGMPQFNQQEIHPHGAGSGIIISPDGYILTNNHVVQNTEQVTVTFDGKGYLAKVIGTDPVTDIAVCKIDAKGLKLPVADLGDSDSIRIGDWAIAVGNPLDIGTTVTLGIISAKNRTNLSAEGHRLNSVIQTDAAINPGNSGGALANINGQVIGINEAIISPTGSYVGIGFAIPINAARKIAAELIQDGKVIRPYLGVEYEPLKEIDAATRTSLGIDLKGDDGVIVTQVYPGSPAEAAGLQRYDVILEANREKITDSDQLLEIIQKQKVGDNLVLAVYRNGETKIMSVVLKERPADLDERSEQQQPEQQQPQIQIGP
ncbi:MAG: S1C family serine protease [Capsulimonadaceae bacterium]